ncbi:MAG: class I SAM-dependent methyltransferase [Armatimonadota bacterium]|nr:class I SAM-dependent methyltransferase [Armatimonadota bacterium]MDW8024282.1 class I SAM-dependent methyltransferase [Armatimonadota bacterium]
MLDVGCGTGGNLELLSSYGVCIGVDISPFALSLCREHWDGLLICADALRLPLRDGAVGLLAALDVLEHIEDDVSALKELWRILSPGGVLVLTVPAFKWLWSGHDIALRHFRRYARAELEAKLIAVGFKVEKISFAICPLLPFVFLFRKLQLIAQSGARKHTAIIKLPKPLNELFIGMLGLEARLIKRLELPFGISLVCRAVKTS